MKSKKSTATTASKVNVAKTKSPSTKTLKDNSQPIAGDSKLLENVKLFTVTLKGKAGLADIFTKIYLDNKGDWPAVKSLLTKNTSFSKKTLDTIFFTHGLMSWGKNNTVLVDTFLKDPATHSLRDIALNYNKQALLSNIPDAAIPSSQTRQDFANQLYNNLYEQESTAVVVNMINDPKVPLWNNSMGKVVSAILAKVPDFNIKTTSVYEVINDRTLLEKIAKKNVDAAINSLKTLQRVVLMSPVPEAVPALINNNYLSINEVIVLPIGQFVATMQASELPGEVLNHIYTEALKKKAFYEHALLTIKEAGMQSGIAMIDGMGGKNANDNFRVDPEVLGLLTKNNLSWDLLFGDADFCDCGECTSVYSAAAYYVDLLQYLRNNNLDGEKINPKDILGPPLAALFARRPDLGHLELTCKNTNTILPYVDLVNEVMEQYIALKPENFNNYKGFNVADETSGELLSTPQHTERSAYEVLQNTLFPFNLPYHQPIDATRLFLKQLNTSRYEVIDTFRSNRADLKFEIGADAEFLGLTEEEYCIIVGKNFSGVADSRSTKDYYGLGTVGNWQEQLSRVKDEFLPRTGLRYSELIELLQTEYINPGLAVPEYKEMLGSLSQPFAAAWLTYQDDMGNNLMTDNPQLKNLLDKYDEKKRSQKLSGFFNSIPGCTVLNSPDNDCSLDKVTLLRYDDDFLSADDYDKFNRFIRLWRKLGFTIDETSQAIMSLDNGDISPELIHQFTAVEKIMDITGIELSKVLCFWGNIGTTGDNALYKRLFLNHSLAALDPVFKAGLPGTEVLSDHLPAVMGALNLSASDISLISTYKSLPEPLTLSLEHLSLLYRYRLLSKTLGLNIPAFIKLMEVAGDVFESPGITLRFLKNIAETEAVGFTFDQLSYIVNGAGNLLDKKEITALAKRIHDGQTAIEAEHANLVADTSAVTNDGKLESLKNKATIELVRTKATLLFESDRAEKIISILEGTTLYCTSAPNLADTVLTDNNGLPASLKLKVKYLKTASATTGSLQVTGALTADELTQLKRAATGSSWTHAVAEIKRLQDELFNDTLAGIFATSPVEEAILRSENNTDSAPLKRIAFLKVFLPYLREKLIQTRLVAVLAEQTGLDHSMVQSLVINIIKPDGISLYSQLTTSVQLPVSTSGGVSWYGKLIPVLEDNFVFIARFRVNTTFSIRLDNELLLAHNGAQTNEAIELRSPAIKLTAGKVYQLSLEGISLEDLYWKTETSAVENIPAKALLPDAKKKATRSTLEQLGKMAILINGLSLSADELNYINANHSDFGDINFSDLSFYHLLRIIRYCNLRNSLPKTSTNLLQFWKQLGDLEPGLAEQIVQVTKWRKEQVEQLIATPHFNLGKDDFRNEKNLLRLQQCLSVATKIGIHIDTLFQWAIPSSAFNTTMSIAESVQMALRAKYNQTDWEQVVKPLNDVLRNNQKNALIAYLLQQQELKTASVTDADGLFEYFLIDVQMDTCMETSRIKQAISSVQLFIQRCFLGLEETLNRIGPDALDRSRWEWMQRYRVWEANRKVFLYPENWIESNLRDDKSPFFKELESELLQKDINKQAVTDALKTYLYKVDEVANMEVIGLYIEGNKDEDTSWKSGARLHVFSRTRNAPYFFYYRYMALDEMNWYPWEKMQVDIQSYDVEDADGQITGNGCYLSPVVWNGRLLIFFPQIVKKTKPNPDATGKIVALADKEQSNLKPIEYYEIKMAWSEYRNGKWTQKQIGKNIDQTHTVNESANNNAELIEAEQQAIRKLNLAVKEEKKCREQKENAEEMLDIAKTPRGSKPPSAATIHARQTILTQKTEAHNKSLAALEAARSELQVAQDALKNTINSSTIEVIGKIYLFEFVPVHSDDNTLLGIKVFYQNSEVGIVEFNGNCLQQASKNYSGNNLITPNYFHYTKTSDNSSSISSLQTNGTYDYYFNRTPESVNFNSIYFSHPFTRNLLGIINSNKQEDFFTSNLSFGTIYQVSQGVQTNIADAFGKITDSSDNKIYHELKRPYSLYNWELFFHTPIMIADALSKAQQFEESMKWFHYVFNPISDGPDDNRFWMFHPFKEINSKNILAQFFGNLNVNEADTAISEWRNNPFKPHVVARSRPVAYMKWVVMKYIDNILDWGDYLFRQDTIESINQATQLYILAGHILGRRPTVIPKRGEFTIQTYNSLIDKWDAFSNAISEMEVAAIYTIQQVQDTGINASNTTSADIFGSVSSLYFCIPNNPKLMGYWDTLADRLFKIRHCQNIEGVFRKLPLFEPPIDPALLAKAAAQGISIASVVNDLNTPMPNYRFYYLLQKALELCNELKSLGGSMLAAIEKKDNETISLIRARHEGTMNNLVMEIKKLQLEEAQKSLDSLLQNRKAPEARMKYYLQLIGEDEMKIPTADIDFNELVNAIDTPIEYTGLKLSKYEKEDVDKSFAAADWQIGIGIVETLASVFHALPSISVDVKPFGLGVGSQWGFPNIANAITATGRGLKIHADNLMFQSQMAAKKGGFQRAIQERIFQVNAAGYELKQIDKQITAQQIRIDITNQDIRNHQKQIDNANEVEDFLKNKYSNEELYTWMRGTLKTLYRQVYNLAFDLAKKAEKTYCFERGLSNVNFIQAAYFDTGREGLLAGEQLYVGLKQLEAAYQEKRGYDYEITKHISICKLDPLALLLLKTTGACEFGIPEVLFDMDYPGHFKRRIKSISVSIPCIAGPYTGVNATLRLLGNKFRNSSLANGYPEKMDEQDDRFISYNIPITAIATSSAQNDTGMFELNFKDERYLPFEGAGVVSRWRLELPGIKQFDYNSISDVVLHIKYTASDGGQQLKSAAEQSAIVQLNQVEQQLNETGLHTLISLRHDMPDEWHLLKKKGSTNIIIGGSRLPYLAQTLESTIEQVIFLIKMKNTSDSFSVQVTNNNIEFELNMEMGLFKGASNAIQLEKNFSLSFDSGIEKLEELIMVVKYRGKD